MIFASLPRMQDRAGADQQREADGICQYTADGIDRGEKNRRGLNRSQRFGGGCDISL